MISMMISTSITSISGVVLMSIIDFRLAAAAAGAYVHCHGSRPQPFGGGSVMKLTFWIPARLHWKSTRPIDS